jgi:hypothetical protein
VPWAHFSILPSAPQAVRARKSGIVNPLSPGTDPAISCSSPNMPLGVPPAGSAGTFASHAVSRLPMTPNAVFLPLSRFPIVSPSAPLTLAERRRFAARIDEAADEIEDLLQLSGLTLRGRHRNRCR